MVAELIDLERERFTRPNWHEAVLEGTRSIVQTLASRNHVERWIRAVSAPTLLVHGAEDQVVRLSASRAAANTRPDWDFAVLEDAGHVPMMEVPAAFLDVVDTWMDRVPGLRDLVPSAAAAQTA
ncbi:MAG: alpha/beta fold hydrolase [Candidatus Dormibacteraeota bacterium]|nr:alpha/beta fold hydrolase [Candidatus Dormibacteraeota bacterium]